MKELKEVIEVRVPAEEIGYSIMVGSGLIRKLGRLVSEQYNGDKILLVTDKNVHSYYGDKIETILKEAGYSIIRYILPPGEKAKSSQFLQQGYDLLVKNNFQRDNLIIALGGGVVGDLTGFLAASYMRGIPFIQIPTTLLAQVDSSIGGKTAINHSAGKNLIGAFYQPEMVIIDIDFLQTLPERELRTGMAEVIKYGLIADSEFFAYLMTHKNEIYNLEASSLTHIISRSCSIKAEIVEEDQKEKGKRALLNFGHTIGHGLEAVTNYEKYNHGEAVAIGMFGAGKLAYEIGFLDRESLEKIETIIKLYELPVSFQYEGNIDDLLQALYHDKKMKNNKLRWVLLDKIGNAFIENNVNENIVKKVLEGLI